jgi:hypothetical protein
LNFDCLYERRDKKIQNEIIFAQNNLWIACNKKTDHVGPTQRRKKSILFWIIFWINGNDFGNFCRVKHKYHSGGEAAEFFLPFLALLLLLLRNLLMNLPLKFPYYFSKSGRGPPRR